MGKHFVMSKRFNKSSASDFGFLSTSATTAVNPIDNSTWVKTELFDFGWGKENGFYKSPLPNFNSLFELALYSSDSDDMYGAASMILDKYSEELLQTCEVIMNDSSRKADFEKLVQLFNLKLPINRSPTVNKTINQVQNDYIRWVKVSEAAKKS